MIADNISIEEKIFFSLSQPSLTKKDQLEIETLIKDFDDQTFQKVYQLSQNNGVSGLIYKNSKDLNIFPDAIKSDLQKFYKKTAFANMIALRELTIILKLLSQNKIPTIPLKGVFASDFVFNDFGVYPSGDIDILVHPDDLFKSKKIFCEELGYFQVDSISEKDLLANHYHLNLKKRMLLEVHWNLVKRYFKIPPDYWWETTNETTWNNTNIVELSVENNILYIIFRLFDHCFYPLRFYILLIGIINKNSDRIDWIYLFETANKYKMKKLVVYTLKLANGLWGTTIPESITSQQYLGYYPFKKLVLSGIRSGIEKKHLRMMVYALLLINYRDILLILFGRIFPTPGELRLRYNLPPKSKKIYLYYILNPFLLLMNSKKESNA